MKKRKLAPYAIDRRDEVVYRLYKEGLNDEDLLEIFNFGRVLLYKILKEQKGKITYDEIER